eukprot:355005-Chlamydomonas_euryale.AAC.2
MQPGPWDVYATGAMGCKCNRGHGIHMQQGPQEGRPAKRFRASRDVCFKQVGSCSLPGQVGSLPDQVGSCSLPGRLCVCVCVAPLAAQPPPAECHPVNQMGSTRSLSTAYPAARTRGSGRRKREKK